ncbi:MAG: hypothetical protein H0T62_12260 [Parachlamydiaceae bacterium]|nr:hypothetical protein [Parachlamydiaceae bacterium]
MYPTTSYEKTYDSGYYSLNPPTEYDSAFAMRSKTKVFEPKLHVKTSWLYLKEYNVQTESMQKAKQYWLNYKCDKPDTIIKCPFDVSMDLDFLRDAELIRRDVWKWHVKVCKEERLCANYHKSALDRHPEDKDPAYFFSTDPHFNKANKNIFLPVEIPETFINLKAYIILEPSDLQDLITQLNYFPDITKEVSHAKRYWSLDITDYDALQIKEKYPKEVEHFRELIWKRHLQLEGERETTAKRCLMWSQEDSELRTKKFWETMKVAATISIISSAVFFCAAIAFSNPLLCIPAAILLICGSLFLTYQLKSISFSQIVEVAYKKD